MKKETLLFNLMLKQGINMGHFSHGHTEDCMINITKTQNDNVANFPDSLYSQT